MRCKWSYTQCFVGLASKIYPRQHAPSLRNSHLAVFSMRFGNVDVVHPHSRIVKATAWEKSSFISSDISDFHMINDMEV